VEVSSLRAPPDHDRAPARRAGEQQSSSPEPRTRIDRNASPGAKRPSQVPAVRPAPAATGTCACGGCAADRRAAQVEPTSVHPSVVPATANHSSVQGGVSSNQQISPDLPGPPPPGTTQPTQVPTVPPPVGSTTPPPACAHPGNSRSVDLQPVFLRVDAHDTAPTGGSWTRRLNKANAIWGKIGVSFAASAPVTVNSPLKTASGATVAEYMSIAGLHSGSGVGVTLVDNDMTSRGGAGTIAGCGASGKMVMSDRGTSDTLMAHELGHTLGLQHPGSGTAHDGDANTIMDPSGSNSVANSERNTMGNYGKLVCPTPAAATCLNPD
jgi:hypothetical protein